jgi:L-lactate utilization protein LutB
VSRKHLTPDEAEALTVRCIRCGAEPGEWCRVYRDLSGRPAALLHDARWLLLLSEQDSQ